MDLTPDELQRVMDALELYDAEYCPADGGWTLALREKFVDELAAQTPAATRVRSNDEKRIEFLRKAP